MYSTLRLARIVGTEIGNFTVNALAGTCDVSCPCRKASRSWMQCSMRQLILLRVMKEWMVKRKFAAFVIPFSPKKSPLADNMVQHHPGTVVNC